MLVSNLKLTFAAMACLAALFAVSETLPGAHREIATFGYQPLLMALAPGSAPYRVAGDFTRNGKPAEAALVTLRIERSLQIMKHQ